MVKPFDKKKFEEEYNYKKHFLEAILVSSITEENSWIPSVKEFVLSEVINGTIDYIGGQVGKITYRDSKDRYETDIFELKANKYLLTQLKSQRNQKLNPNIEKVLKNLCSSNMNTRGNNIELYDFFSEICQIQGRLIFSPQYDTVMRVHNEIFPSLSLVEIENIEGIGKAMRPHIDKDIAYIIKR